MGHKHNDSVGLVYMRARYYLPGLGRFLSADTIVQNVTNPQSLNRFSYTMNNPVRYIDPSGHVVLGEYDEPDRDLTYYMEHPEEEYWMSHNNISEGESLAFGFVGLTGVALIGTAGVELATEGVITAGEAIGKKRLLDGVSNVGGYWFGETITGNFFEINLKDTCLAFVAGVVTPEGSGTGIKRVLTEALYSGTSSAVQEGASQIVHGEALSVDEMAKSGGYGALAGVFGEVFGENIESKVTNFARGFIKGGKELVETVAKSVSGGVIDAGVSFFERIVESVTD